MLSKDNFFIKYLAKFFGIFCVLYYGTIAFIGITVPGGLYSAFAAKYLDYVAFLRYILLHSSNTFLRWMGYDTFIKDVFTIRLTGGLGVHVGYDCIGYGVMFFWLAFILANKGSMVKKAKWIIGGLLLIWLVNVIRISLMLIGVNKNWSTLFNLDNHTLFNIAAYIVIFIMIYFFDRADKQPVKSETVGGS